MMISAVGLPASPMITTLTRPEVSIIGNTIRYSAKMLTTNLKLHR